MQQILEHLRSLEGVLVLAPEADSEDPELAWDDFFFSFAPDEQTPSNEQPYGTWLALRLASGRFYGSTQHHAAPGRDRKRADIRGPLPIG